MIPLSEDNTIRNGEHVIVPAGEVFNRVLGFDLKPDEKREASLSLELHDKAKAMVSIYVRGEGELSINRTVNVLGNDAALDLWLFGETQKSSNVYCSDDVTVQGERVRVDLRTKNVLRDEAKSAVRQRVVLLPSAHGADATQKIDHLLLGEKAVAEGIPELDVQLDDVTCRHGATTSRPDPEAMFYLLSRGLTQDEAEKTFIHGFLGV